MSATSSKDLFICGKCHTNFTDLNIFLTHRSTCVDEQPINICPISSCPLTALLSTDLETLVGDITADLSSTSDPLYEPNSSRTETDQLSSTSDKQVTNNNEIIYTNVSISINDSSVENEISEMNIFECPVCDKQFESQTILEDHIFEHSIWVNKDENTPSKSSLSIDNTSTCCNNVINESLECQQCALTFASNASLNVHKQMFHGLNPVFCCLNGTCCQLFKKPVDYILHAQTHSQKQPSNAQRLSPNNSSCQRRLRRVYRCKICKKLFQTSDQLEYHMQYETHKFLCHLCSTEFQSKNSYHNHLAKHSDLPLYHCTICTKSFQKRAELSQHIITEHKQDISKQNICSICNLTFTTRFHLNRHNVTKHSDIKPFKCQQDGCQQAFARKDKLKQHEAKHRASGGMYKCQDCSKTFVRQEHLRDHYIAKHSHQYPFNCEYCGKGFIYQNQLYDHYKQYHSYGNQTRNQELIYNQNQFNTDQIDSLLF